MLEKIKSYFGCGSIRLNKRDGIYAFTVTKKVDLLDKIIPHFKKYPLKTVKADSFRLFSDICFQLCVCPNKTNLSKSILIDIIQNAYKINASGKRKYTKDFLIQQVLCRADTI